MNKKILKISQAASDAEWKVVLNLRQKNFFDRTNVDDPYTWTFQDSNHVHFVLYQDKQIIGYSHIQLWPEKRSAMRIIVVDESFRNQGIGSYFLKLCEEWLKKNNFISLHVQSSPAAHQYYCRNGYESDPSDIEVGKNL